MAGPPLTKKIEKKHIKKITRPQSNRKGSMELAGRMEAIGKSLFLLLDQLITETVAKSIDAQIRERISKEMKKKTEDAEFFMLAVHMRGGLVVLSRRGKDMNSISFLLWDPLAHQVVTL